MFSKGGWVFKGWMRWGSLDEVGFPAGWIQHQGQGEAHESEIDEPQRLGGVLLLGLRPSWHEG